MRIFIGIVLFSCTISLQASEKPEGQWDEKESYVATHSGKQICTEQGLQEVQEKLTRYQTMYSVKVLTETQLKQNIMQLYLDSITKYGPEIAFLFTMIKTTPVDSGSFQIPLQQSKESTD